MAYIVSAAETYDQLHTPYVSYDAPTAAEALAHLTDLEAFGFSVIVMTAAGRLLSTANVKALAAHEQRSYLKKES